MASERFFQYQRVRVLRPKPEMDF